MKATTFLIILLLGLQTSSDAQIIQYRISGVLEDDSAFKGLFSLNLSSTDEQGLLQFGNFALEDVAIHLYNTTLLQSGPVTATEGRATIGNLLQDSIGQSQSLHFEFVPADGRSNAFTDIVFSGFDDDPNVPQPILIRRFSNGYIDGNGQSAISELNISVVPEPSSFFHLIMGLLGILFGRCRIPMVARR